MPGLTYILPLKWSDTAGVPELGEYLGELCKEVDEVLLMDGSDAPVFEVIDEVVPEGCRHLRPFDEYSFANGKVDGVLTGLRLARNDKVVMADDDVRYEAAELRRIDRLLDEAELVSPQNYFDPLPWYARIETARMLLNRVATGDPRYRCGDFPGTLGVRRDFVLGLGGYDGDVMFENFELIRTVDAAGGRVICARDVLVRRLPPPLRQYRTQRVREAFDDIGIPARLALSLAAGPLAALALARRRIGALAAGAAGVAALAEVGRRVGGGTSRFPASSSLLAPVWVAERAVTSWIALGAHLFKGGVAYRGGRVPRPVSSHRELRERVSAPRPTGPGSPVPHRQVVKGVVVRGVAAGRVGSQYQR